MHIATMLDSAPVAIQPYPLAFKYHGFRETRDKDFARHRNHPQKPFPVGKAYCSNEKTHTRRVTSTVLLGC